MARWAVKPYYSRAFGDQFAALPTAVLSELGLEDAGSIHAHLDGLSPSRVDVVRFDTREEAERWVARVEAT